MTMTTLPDAAATAARRLLAETGTPGAAIAIKIDDAPVVAAGIGAATLDVEPMPSDGRFYLYSVTKLVLATAAMRLVEEGRLALDDDVRNRLPGVDLPVPISLRQVLNHTAGLPDYGGLASYAADLRRDPARPWPDEEFLDRSLAQGLPFAPGEGWAYSNIGYLLVRRIVAGAAGISLGEALLRLVFRPAGLRETGVATSLADGAALVPGYSTQLGDAEPSDVRLRYHPGWVSHGVVTSTAAETARLVAALFDGGLVGPASLAEMLRGVPVPGDHPPFHRAGYGLGLMVDLDPGIALVAGHAGGGPGYATAAFRFETDEGRRVTSVALANRDGGDVALNIAFAVARAALNCPV
jgi:D-alanyl-D-alanine carboxypeptidase